jgi:ubiquinone/menaquinone biosynthesis C-methylase UbiE
LIGVNILSVVDIIIMFNWITAERTSSTLRSDGVIRQRQLAAYHKACDFIHGKSVLEIGCGEGAGTEILSKAAREIVAIDYSEKAVKIAGSRSFSSKIGFQNEKVPPINTPDNTFDVVIMLQMIEHLENPGPLLQEIARVLKKGGMLLVSTVNKKESLSDNPFHLHEFDRDELEVVLREYFTQVEMSGLYGDEKHTQYLNKNKKRVAGVLKLDALGIYPRLPVSLRKILYSTANRLMRMSLRYGCKELCDAISHDNFIFKQNETEGCLDLFAGCTK